MVRLKHRYIIAQTVLGPTAKLQGNLMLTSREIQSELRSKIHELYGDVGLGEFGQATYVRYLDGKYSSIFVVKTTREAQIKVHFALSCLSELAGVQLCIRTLSVSSCPRTCTQALTELFSAYFQHCTDNLSVTERVVAEEVVRKNISGLEL
jgi:RNase P/RNase MRP subunit POP5